MSYFKKIFVDEGLLLLTPNEYECALKRGKTVIETRLDHEKRARKAGRCHDVKEN